MYLIFSEEWATVLHFCKLQHIVLLRIDQVSSAYVPYTISGVDDGVLVTAGSRLSVQARVGLQAGKTLLRADPGHEEEPAGAGQQGCCSA